MKKLVWGILFFSWLGCNQISGINDLNFDTKSTDSTTQDSETESGVLIDTNAKGTSTETSTTPQITDSDADSDTTTDTTSDVVNDLSIAPSTIPTGKYNGMFEFEFEVTGGHSPYTLAAIAGSLPVGVAIINGRLAGRPTQSGNYAFTIQVTDSLNAVNSAEFSWEVHRNKWMSCQDYLNNVLIFNMEVGTGDTVYTAVIGESARTYGFSPLGSSFLHSVNVADLDTLYITNVTDSGAGTTVDVISGSAIRRPNWTPDGQSFAFSVRENSNDTSETVYWGGPGKVPVVIDTISVGTDGSWVAPIDNDTIFYMSLQGAWVVDVVNDAVDMSTKKVVTLPDMPTASYLILLNTVELGASVALEINWQASVGIGPCQNHNHYVVKEDATAYYLGKDCGSCFQHSANYTWYFIPNSNVYGTAIVKLENQSNTIDIAGELSYKSGYNVHWDDANQYVAYFKYTSPYAVKMQNLTTIPFTESEMKVNGVEFNSFGGLSSDGTKILASSLTSVYGANITNGIIDTPQAISPDLGTEEVNTLTISPNGDYAAYIGYIYESADPSGNVYIADLNQMKHQRSCMNATIQNDGYPTPFFIKFSPDGTTLFYVVASKATNGTYSLYTVNLENKTDARFVSTVGNASPELYF